jgi:hypothetical protein
LRGRQALSLDVIERVADGLHIPGRTLALGDRPWEREANNCGSTPSRRSSPSKKTRRNTAATGAAPAPARRSFDAGWYKNRNTVERCFSKLKQFRAVATRYDKRERIYQGTIDVASISIWLRDPVP